MITPAFKHGKAIQFSSPLSKSLPDDGRFFFAKLDFDVVGDPAGWHGNGLAPEDSEGGDTAAESSYRSRAGILVDSIVNVG